jgi:hypothetical protein
VGIGSGQHRAVFELANTGDLGAARLRDKSNLVSGLGQMTGDVGILARHVLMDEEKSHPATHEPAL